MGASRRYVYPEPGDTISSLATRLLPGDDDAVSRLLSWNLHLALRPYPPGDAGEVLCTDIVYVEPPPA